VHVLKYTVIGCILMEDQVGPKGLEFARYSLDYHTIRNYLHVSRAWGKQRAERHIPGYARKIVEAYDGDGRIQSMLHNHYS
jgi:7-hydroxymethyl chlorophyll a reductase